MELKNKPSNAWYEKTWLVIILCIIFFPVGLYALWKNSTIGKGWKIGVTVIFAVIIIANLGGKDNSVSSVDQINSTTTEVQYSSEPEKISLNSTDDVEQEKVNAEKQTIIEKLKIRAKRDWPNDYTTQEYWINEQIEAYEYMLTIEDDAIKKQAQRDWPLDFSTQKFWYNEQIEARERLK